MRSICFSSSERSGKAPHEVGQSSAAVVHETVSPTTLLRTVRECLYASARRRADALFELIDAVLSVSSVPSVPHLSLTAVLRRGWGSLYAALSKGRLDEEALRDLLARHPLDPDRQQDGPPVYAVDVTPWPRCDAEANPERGYHYHPSRHSAGQPVVAGWAYQLVAQIGFARDTWVAPVDGRRVHPTEGTNDVAAEQVWHSAPQIPYQTAAHPLFVFDAGYDPVRLQRELQGHGAQLLVRLHSNRVFYADPEQEIPRPVGGPQRHGAKFDLQDPDTWPEPSAEHHCEDDYYGGVRVMVDGGMVRPYKGAVGIML